MFTPVLSLQLCIVEREKTKVTELAKSSESLFERAEVIIYRGGVQQLPLDLPDLMECSLFLFEYRRFRDRFTRGLPSWSW